MKTKILNLFLSAVLSGSITSVGFAQELNCNVQVISPQIQSSDKRIFETLRKAIYEFMNNIKWTNDIYKFEERIECSILLNITDKISVDEFKGTMQVQVRRPVFNSSYNSLLLNFSDNNIQFKYLEYEPLEFSENAQLSNLTSILAYFANIIIGLDYDSFSPEGGSQYFLKAQTIVNNAQNVQEPGWKAFEGDKNRYWLVDNILDQVFKPYRECIFGYHRQGLDRMHDNLDQARTGILESLELLQKVHISKPGSFLLRVFFDAKSDEIVNIFSESYPPEKTRLATLLYRIDPANTTKYKKITGEK